MTENGNGLDLIHSGSEPDGEDTHSRRRQPASMETHMASGRPRVLVAIPSYNEEVAIGSLVIRTKRYADEIVVIDDGSSDDTTEIAREAGAVVIQNDRNRGKGYSVRRAFRYAKERGADCLVLMDGDGQHDPDEIPNLVEPVLREAPEGGQTTLPQTNDQTNGHGSNGGNGNGANGHTNGNGANGHTNGGASKTPADVALGFRVGEMSEMPGWRRIGKRVLDYATATATGTAEMLTDSQCGFRAFGPAAIEAMAQRLNGDDFGVESEQLVIAKDHNLVMENVKIHCRYDDIENASTKGPVAHGFGVLENIIEMVTQRRPLLFMGLPSILLLVAGGGLGIYTIQYWGWTGYFSMPYALASATMMLIGMLGIMTALILNIVGSFEDKVSKAIEDNLDASV